MIEIPTTEAGFVDIRLYVYESIKTHLSGELSADRVIMREQENISQILRPFVSITKLGGNTNARGIRTQDFQIDVWADTIGSSESIADKIIDLFNRRNWKGIRSLLERDQPDNNDMNSGLFRRTLDFTFTFKDQKY